MQNLSPTHVQVGVGGALMGSHMPKDQSDSVCHAKPMFNQGRPNMSLHGVVIAGGRGEEEGE